MIKHIIFDCFGTLIDTGNGSIKAVESILHNIGAFVDAKTFYADWKDAKKQMMDSSKFRNEKTLFELSLAETFDKYGIGANASEEVKPMINSLFAERTVFPEVKETLQKLAEKEIDVAIGSTTDTDSLIHYLSSNHLAFSHIYTSEDMKVYKPNPDFYKTILNRSGWAVSECLFVGDSYLDDVYGPKSIGMRAALIDRKERYKGITLNPKPDYIIHTLGEVLKLS